MNGQNETPQGPARAGVTTVEQPAGANPMHADTGAGNMGVAIDIPGLHTVEYGNHANEPEELTLNRPVTNPHSGAFSDVRITPHDEMDRAHPLPANERTVEGRQLTNTENTVNRAFAEFAAIAKDNPQVNVAFGNLLAALQEWHRQPTNTETPHTPTAQLTTEPASDAGHGGITHITATEEPADMHSQGQIQQIDAPTTPTLSSAESRTSDADSSIPSNTRSIMAPPGAIFQSPPESSMPLSPTPFSSSEQPSDAVAGSPAHTTPAELPPMPNTPPPTQPS